MTPPIDTMTEADFIRMMGWDPERKRRKVGAYRVIGRASRHEGRFSQFQACRSLPAAMKSAAMAAGKRFRLTDVRIVIVL